MLRVKRRYAPRLLRRDFASRLPAADSLVADGRKSRGRFPEAEEGCSVHCMKDRPKRSTFFNSAGSVALYLRHVTLSVTFTVSSADCLLYFIVHLVVFGLWTNMSLTASTNACQSERSTMSAKCTSRFFWERSRLWMRCRFTPRPRVWRGHHARGSRLKT